MAPKTEGPPTLVIAIDFGTTYSGVAWKFGDRDFEATQTVTDWITVKNYSVDAPKAPSTILYRDPNDKDPPWGYLTPFGDGILRWFKLLLVNERDLPENVRDSNMLRDARELMQQLKKTPVQIFSDYLRNVWEYSLERIAAAGEKEWASIYRVHFVVTLPAIWPHYVRPRMLEAMKIAGLFDLTMDGNTSYSFISEPEAAALACLRENAGRSTLEVGDHFIVCDAGGGTVDIITYKIEKLNPLTISESVKGDGGLCGGIFLDEKFLNLLRNTIPKETQKKLAREAGQRIVKDDWEAGIKTALCKASSKYDIHLIYKGPVNSQFFRPSFSLEADEIREKVYNPVIDEIKQLIATQIKQVEELYKKPPKFVFLVGGFGRSKYLYECLGDTFGRKLDIIQKRGTDPWSAVLRGAVLHGLSKAGLADSITAVVDSRISRHNYGTVFNDCPFDMNKHDIRDREYCPYDKDWIAVDQTEWYIGIGDIVSTYAPISFPCYQALIDSGQGLQIEIVTSDSVEPPARKDGSVKTLCVITIPLDYQIWTKLRKEVSDDGKVFRRISYDLRMISDGSSLEFTVWYRDQCLASQSVDFESAQMEKEEATNDGGDSNAQMRDTHDAAVDLPTVIEIDDTDDEYVPDRDDEDSLGGYE
ncbi:heat shock 70 kda 12b [Fusarium longipes]|uniref:Heat shock 70 kDa 12b n=1 Tax=Fusarium longipes TaxID=694270 RepID=A0A395SD33_9HYPO|nr:heat shock 70 kda 12b [Fusarium longipes]